MFKKEIILFCLEETFGERLQCPAGLSQLYSVHRKADGQKEKFSLHGQHAALSQHCERQLRPVKDDLVKRRVSVFRIYSLLKAS